MSSSQIWHTPQATFSDILASLPLTGEVIDLRNKIIAIPNVDLASSLMEEISFRIDVCCDSQCEEDQYIYYLFESYCHLGLDQAEEAIQFAMEATDGFRMCGNNWAQIFGHWFLGTIYASQRRGYLYLAEINHALDLLEAIRQNSLVKGEYDVVSRCQLLIKQLLENKENAVKMGTGPLHMPGKTAPPSPPSATPDSGRILLPWIPKFQKVRAGVGGTAIWVQNTPEYSFATIVEIDNKPHRIHPLRGTAPSDQNVTLVNGERYGWALVEGHSMNMCHPATIEDGDYILFREHKIPDDHDIVVVARPIASGDFTHMVKRYRDPGKLLLSETDAIGPEYSPVKFGPEYQILGVVLAVAKSET